MAQIIENAVLLTDSNLILPRHLGMVSTNPSPFARQLCTLKENDEAHLVYVLTNANGDRGKVCTNSWNNRQTTSTQNCRHEKKSSVGINSARHLSHKR